MTLRSLPATTLLLALTISCCAGAQNTRNALSDKEVEEIREARYVPSECILLFVKFLDARTKAVTALYARGRRPGREEDTRELMTQIASLADELGDNLDDYGPRHQDLRKALPKVVDGSDRWASELRALPEDETYSVARKLALESIRDLRESATEMEPEQEKWFKDHPPAKQDAGRAPPIDIPR